jgi:hypothetical protein
MAKLKPANPATYWPWYASRIAFAPKHRQAGMQQVLRENAPKVAESINQTP